MIAIKYLFPNVKIDAVEINKKACSYLKKLEFISNIYNESIVDFTPKKKYDFVFTKGVLIHISPSILKKVYSIIYKSSDNYICFIEYYNPTPINVEYRGHKNLLFKRDFAGEFMDMFRDISLVNYGFVYHKDNVFPQDDAFWFLLKKNK